MSFSTEISTGNVEMTGYVPAHIPAVPPSGSIGIEAGPPGRLALQPLVEPGQNGFGPYFSFAVIQNVMILIIDLNIFHYSSEELEGCE